MMLQVLSFALFSAVLSISVAVIVATIKADLPLILKALGVAPSPYAPYRPDGDRRPERIVRVRQIRLAPTEQFRAAA